MQPHRPSYVRPRESQARRPSTRRSPLSPEKSPLRPLRAAETAVPAPPATGATPGPREPPPKPQTGRCRSSARPVVTCHTQRHEATSARRSQRRRRRRSTHSPAPAIVPTPGQYVGMASGEWGGHAASRSRVNHSCMMHRACEREDMVDARAAGAPDACGDPSMVAGTPQPMVPTLPPRSRAPARTIAHNVA